MTRTDTMTDQSRVDPRTALLGWCAAASFGVLFIKSNSLLQVSATRPDSPLIMTPGVADYLPLVAPALALVLWAVFPRRAWPWLLLAGALCSAPQPVASLTPGVFPGWTWPFTVIVGSAPAFTLVGVLGAASLMWHAGRRASSASLVGTALVVQLVGPVVIGSAMLETPGFYRVLAIALTLLAIVGSIFATVVAKGATPPEVPRPGWRVTAAASVAALSGGLPLVWRFNPYGYVGDPEVLASSVADYYLRIGLVFLAIGLVVGALAGLRSLLCALTAGLLIGTFGMLIEPSVEVLQEIVVIAVIAVAVSLAIGWVATLSRWRAQIGATGLAVVVVGLLVLFGIFDSDDPPDDGTGFTKGLTPVLLVVGVVAAVAAMGSVGSYLAPALETPAVLAGLTTPFALGAITIIAHFTITTPPDRAPLVGLLPGAAAGLFIPAVLLMLLVQRHRQAPVVPQEEPSLVPR